ncbi:MAG: hypothetical protein AB8B55_22160 [Mariniblastus sp.]
MFYCVPGIGNGPYVRNGAEVDNERQEPKLNVSKGKFELPLKDEGARLLIFAKEGCANLLAKDLEKTDRVDLKGWARVEGVAKVGSKLAVGERISLSIQHEAKAYLFDYDTVVAKDGKFVFSCVPPDMKNPTVYRQVIISSRGGGSIVGSSFRNRIKLTPGETTNVEIGGTGRPVIGKLIVPPGYKKPVTDWNQGNTNLVREIAGPAGKVEEYHGFSILADGSFRIEDIPAGIYRFKSRVAEEGEAMWKSGPTIGRVEIRIEIEAMDGGRSDTPLDLGELQLR